jgi:hypothetical protein
MAASDRLRRNLALGIASVTFLVGGGCRTARLAASPEHGAETEHALDARGHGSGPSEPHRAPTHGALPVDRPLALGACLRRGWCEPADHAHESRCGTPYVHAFHAEPAFLGRDLLVHVEEEGDEHSLEVEVEWALSRRLLLVAEVPFGWTTDGSGPGDAGLALRALGIETDRFLLSGQVSVEMPTAANDLGAGEAIVAPGLTSWLDLGHWFTAQASATLEAGTESGDLGLSWAAVLAKSFRCPTALPGCGCDAPGHDEPGHGHESVLTLFLEGRGGHALSGADEGTAEYEVLLGVSVPFSSDVDLRAGWTTLWADDADAPDHGWVLGFVLHL